jgi:hypothetical protein
MALTAGSLDSHDEFFPQDCMAKAIEDALPSAPEFGKRERRLLLIAIAAGVINHLRDHAADGFVVTVANHTAPGDPTHSAKLEIP